MTPLPAVGPRATLTNTTGNDNTVVSFERCTPMGTAVISPVSVTSAPRLLTRSPTRLRVRTLLLVRATGLVLEGTGEYGVKVGIGTTTPSNALTIARGAGHPVSDSWENHSSRRWKTNIKTLPDALRKVERLRGVSHDLKDSGKHEIGVIAEEVGQVLPEVVSYEANGKDGSGVNYSRLGRRISSRSLHEVLILPTPLSGTVCGIQVRRAGSR